MIDSFLSEYEFRGIRSLAMHASPALKAKIVESRVLTGGEAKIEQAADGIVIRMPVGSQDKLDTIVKLELERPGRAK